MKKIVLVLSLVVCSNANIFAQENPKLRAWELEVDPIAFILNGYSVHVIHQVGKWRFDAGVFGIKQPEFFHGNEGFEMYSQGFGLKANYVFKGIEGFFAGVDAGYITHDAKYLATGQSDRAGTISTGIMGGYRFFFYKDKSGNPTGLFLSPWLGLSYSFYTSKIEIKDQPFKMGNFGYFPTVHIGYRF